MLTASPSGTVVVAHTEVKSPSFDKICASPPAMPSRVATISLASIRLKAVERASASLVLTASATTVTASGRRAAARVDNVAEPAMRIEAEAERARRGDGAVSHFRYLEHTGAVLRIGNASTPRPLTWRGADSAAFAHIDHGALDAAGLQ